MFYREKLSAVSKNVKWNNAVLGKVFAWIYDRLGSGRGWMKITSQIIVKMDFYEVGAKTEVWLKEVIQSDSKS